MLNAAGLINPSAYAPLQLFFLNNTNTSTNIFCITGNWQFGDGLADARTFLPTTNFYNGGYMWSNSIGQAIVPVGGGNWSIQDNPTNGNISLAYASSWLVGAQTPPPVSAWTFDTGD